MKIMYVICDTNIGGAQNNLVQTAKFMAKKHEVLFVVQRVEGELSNELKDIDNLKVVCLYQNSMLDFKSYFSLKNIICNYKPDIIHSQLFFSNNIMRLMKFIGVYKKSLISGERTNKFSPSWEKEPYYSISLYLDRFLYRYSDTLIANNNELIADFKRLKYDTSKIKLIYNGIDLSHSKSNKEEQIDGKFIFCFSGRLHKVKNLRYLIEQFSLLQKRHENSVLNIIGDGEEKKELVNLTKKLNLKNVNFLGALTKNELLSKLQESHVCVISSIYEGLSNSLLEYGVLAKPVIVSNIEGNKIVIKNEDYGYIFDLKVKDDLYTKMKEAIDDYKLASQKGVNLYKLIEDDFSIDNMIKKIELIYMKGFKKYE